MAEAMTDGEQHRVRVEGSVLDAIQERIGSLPEDADAVDHAQVIVALSEAYRNLRSGR